VVVLEDLHWADPDTLAVLEYVADNLSAVLAAMAWADWRTNQPARPDQDHWGGHPAR
jgi:predicted ATPase